MNMHINRTDLKDIQGSILIHEHVFNLFPFRKKNKNYVYAIEKLHQAEEKGIEVIVDLTPYSKIYNYYDLIDSTNLKIVSCTGFYTGKYILPKYKNCSESFLVDKMIKDIKFGVGKRKLKASIIKMATNSINLKEYEKKIFNAAIYVSNLFQIPVVLHAPKNTRKHFDYLINNGMDPKRLLISHLEKEISLEGFKKFQEDSLYIFEHNGNIQISEFYRKQKTYINLLWFVKNTLQSKYKYNLFLSSDFNWRWTKQEIIPKKNDGIEASYTYIFDSLINQQEIAFSLDELNQIFKVNPLLFLKGNI